MQEVWSISFVNSSVLDHLLSSLDHRTTVSIISIRIEKAPIGIPVIVSMCWYRYFRYIEYRYDALLSDVKVSITIITSSLHVNIYHSRLQSGAFAAQHFAAQPLSCPTVQSAHIHRLAKPNKKWKCSTTGSSLIRPSTKLEEPDSRRMD